jgi:hypothetical protein
MIHSDQIAEVQLRLSGGTDKHLACYRPALMEVFNGLSEDDRDHCETLAGQWNNGQLPEDIQRK